MAYGCYQVHRRKYVYDTPMRTAKKKKDRKASLEDVNFKVARKCRLNLILIIFWVLSKETAKKFRKDTFSNSSKHIFFD